MLLEVKHDEKWLLMKMEIIQETWTGRNRPETSTITQSMKHLNSIEAYKTLTKNSEQKVSITATVKFHTHN